MTSFHHRESGGGSCTATRSPACELTRRAIMHRCMLVPKPPAAAGDRRAKTVGVTLCKGHIHEMGVQKRGWSNQDSPTSVLLGTGKTVRSADA